MSTNGKNYQMSRLSRQEYLGVMRKKYKRLKKNQKKERSKLLSDVVDITGYHRTYASVLLRSPPPKAIIRKPRTARYSVETKQVVLLLWHATSNICAERLQPFMPELLDKLVACGELAVRPEIDDQLRQISLATVKRIVSREKRRSIIRIGGTTKPGSLLKRQISVRYGRWDETTPGWCETDTVAHCGDTLAGTFIYSLNLTDVATSWSEQVAIMGKGERASVTGLDSARKRLPFKLLGIDSDNGSEFINWHMARYAKNNRLTFTRSRPYRKNDQAHVEQKNWTAIRQLVGYQRMDTNEQLESLNDLYQNEWRQYLNFFQPTMKVKETVKDQATGKKTKRYYPAQTPYQRLMSHPNVSDKQKAMLQSQYDSLNPAKLQREIQRKLKALETSFSKIVK
ncbi:hypothetical protein IPL85_04970 [Candidatus Saccharibacteria bacterium]|nr:MAG: hypothetical protein IPL85_04970 [Candidatus Saccharibacteria bacterium]